MSSCLLCHILSPPDGHLCSIFKVDIMFYICFPPFPVLTDYTGSEENIDISVLGLQSKLNLPLKSPPSHNHKPEAYPSRPGYSYSEQIHVDGGYCCDRVCVCDCMWLPLPSILLFNYSGFNPTCCCFSLIRITSGNCVQMFLLTLRPAELNRLLSQIKPNLLTLG